MHRFLQFVAGLFGIALLLAIVEFLPSPRSTYFWDRAYDTGHILVFGIGVIMSLTMSRAYFGRYRKRWQYGASCALTLGLGLLLEVWQSTRGRSAEWIDVYSDAVGILAFAAIYAMIDKRIERPRKGMLRQDRLALFAVIVLILGLLPFIQTVDLYRVRYQLLPSLIDWEQPWYAKFYYQQSADFSVVDQPPNWPADAKQVGKVARLTLARRGKYPGFVFREPYSNWTDYRALEMDVLYSDSKARRFILRVHDVGHNNNYDDRFNTVITLQPGFQTLRFPMDEIEITPSGRYLNLVNIESFAFFTTDLEAEITLFLGDIRLVP